MISCQEVMAQIHSLSAQEKTQFTVVQDKIGLKVEVVKPSLMAGKMMILFLLDRRLLRQFTVVMVMISLLQKKVWVLVNSMVVVAMIRFMLRRTINIL